MNRLAVGFAVGALCASSAAIAQNTNGNPLVPAGAGGSGSSSLAAGTTPITGCTNGYFLYDAAGVLGCSASASSIAFPQAVTSGVSGGIPYFASATSMAASALLTQHALILGGGAGAAPTPLGSLGTTTTVLHGNASGAPSFGAVALSTDVSGTLQAAQEPAHTGDMTNTAGSLATTVGSIGGKSVTLGGSLTTSGAYGLTETLTNTTSVTLPTSGTLATTANLNTALPSATASQLYVGTGGAGAAAAASTLPTGAEPAHTGDVTNTGGSLAMTLATVNAGPGSVGSSTAIPVLTTNGKGLVTAQTTAAVIAPAGTLSGGTLSSGVTASSLTSVGTLTGGATGSGFTVNMGSSTISGNLPIANLASGSGASSSTFLRGDNTWATPSGSGTVTSVATTCPTSSNSPVAGVVTISGGVASVTRSGSSDTLASGDCAKDVVYSYAGSVSVALPSASSLGSGWFVSLTAATGASVTVTSAGGNFSSTGGTTLTIAAGGSAAIVSDGTNFTVNAPGAGGSPGGATDEVQINNSGSFGGGGVTVTGNPGTLGSLDTGGTAFISNYWYNFQPSAVMATASVQVASQIYCSPNVIDHSGFVAVGLGTRVVTGYATGHISLALYQANGTNGRPGTEIVDTGALATTNSNTDVSGTFTATPLPRGVYWICSTVDNTTNVLIAMSSAYSAGFGERYVGSSTVAGSIGTANANSGVQCLSGGSCGGSTTAWSGSTFTWATLSGSGSTWTAGGSGSIYTAIGVQSQ